MDNSGTSLAINQLTRELARTNRILEKMQKQLALSYRKTECEDEDEPDDEFEDEDDDF